MIDLYIAKDQDGQIWLFNKEPDLINGDWISDLGGEILYLGTEFDVYLEPGECKRVSNINIEVEQQ